MCNVIALSNKIQYARMVKGLKQKEMCEVLNISQSMYSKIESGMFDMKISTLFKIASILDISAQWLISDDELPVNESYSKETNNNIKTTSILKHVHNI